MNSCRKKYELKKEEIDDFSDQLFDMGCFNLQISGGEPLLINNIEEILSDVSKKMKIYLITNGSLLNKGRIKILSKINIKSFQISLDSLNPEIYNVIRSKNVLDLVIKNINTASKMFGERFTIGTVMLKDNKNEYEKIFLFADSINSNFTLIPLLTTGRGKLKNQDIDISEKVSALENIFKLDNNEKFKPVFPRAFYPEKRISDGNIYGYCSFPHIVGIMPDGNVYPCEGLRNITELKIGNLKNEKLEDIWNKSKIISKLTKIKPADLKGVCKQCKHKDTCIGGCRASAFLHYGNFNMPDPLCQKAYERGIFPKDRLL